MGRILAIDFGKRHIGLAISDENKVIASGLDSIHYKKPNEVIDKLQKLISEKNIEKIILGYPISMSGKITKIALEVLNFKELLAEKIDIPIELLDERLTTEISKKIVAQIKRKPTPPKSLLDKISAIIMLQDYLSQQRKK